MQKLLWFVGGLMMGLTALSITKASVPSKTALDQNLSEIRVPKHGKINFDDEIAQLSQKESRFQEKLPLSQQQRFKSAAQRVSQEKYKFSGASSRKR